MAYDHISGHGKDGVLQRIHCEFTEDEMRVIKDALTIHYQTCKVAHSSLGDRFEYKDLNALFDLMDYFEIEIEADRL